MHMDVNIGLVPYPVRSIFTKIYDTLTMPMGHGRITRIRGEAFPTQPLLHFENQGYHILSSIPRNLLADHAGSIKGCSHHEVNMTTHRGDNGAGESAALRLH
jgi:hypothetical protein